MFVFRAASVDLEVPVVARGRLQEPLAEVARREAETLALHLRVSFLWAAAGERPQVYGHSSLGPKLSFSCKSSRAEGAARASLLLAASQPQAFVFYPRNAGPEWQLHVEVVVAEDLPAQPAWSGKGTSGGHRAWRLAGAVAKEVARAQPGVATVAQQTQMVPTGAKATRQETPSPALCPVAWALVRFDLATDALTELRRPWPKRPLRPGSLREHLLEQSGEWRAQERAALDRFCRLASRGTLECEVELVPLPPLAPRVLPPDFPAYVGAQRLGGATVTLRPGDVPTLSADIGDTRRTDSLVRGIVVVVPSDGWLSTLLQALPPVDGQQGTWHVQAMHMLLGTHNALRWLDSSLAARRQAGASSQPLVDDSGHMWRLQLTPQEQSRRWTFDGDVPIEFVCDPDCAVVLELVATLRFSPGASPFAAPLPGESLGGPSLHTKTLGWLLALPLYHATDEALQSAAVAGALALNLSLRQGPGPSLTGQEVWAPMQPFGLEYMSPPQPLRVAFSLVGERMLAYLRRSQRFRALSAPQPAAMAPAACAPDFEMPQVLSFAPETFPPLPEAPAAPVPPAAPAATAPEAAAAAAAAAPEAAAAPAEPAPPEAQPVAPVAEASEAQPAAVVEAAAPAAPAAPAEPPLPPEWRTVVEKVYLRDQGTQSDAPTPEALGQVISEARPLAEPPRTRRYTGPLMQPINEVEKSQLIAELGDTAAGRLLRGVRPPEQSRDGRRDLRWKLERDDPLQADEVTFEFVAYRNCVGTAGERIYMQLRFFAFPPMRTSPAALAGGPGEACLLRSVTTERLALAYHIDGSAPGNPGGIQEVHRQLVEYLAARSAQLELWNLDAAMRVGRVDVPLEWLVRQGNAVARKEGEFPVLDPLTGDTRGFLKLVMTCRGRHRDRRQLALLGETACEAAGGERVRSRTRHKARALLSLEAGAEALLGSAADTPEEAQKKQLRLTQFRVLRRMDMPGDHSSDQIALLSAAEEARQERKRTEIARRMEQFSTTKQTVHAQFASPAFFHLDFENPYSQQSIFAVVIAERGSQAYASATAPAPSPVQGVLAPPEQPLCLLCDPEEWRRLATARLVPPAPAGDFARLSLGRGLFTLAPREVVSLPLRYLAFDHPGDAITAPSAGVSFLEARGIAERRFVVEVLLHQGPVLRRAEITVRPQACPIAESLCFFEPEGTAVEKVLAWRKEATGLSESEGTAQSYALCTERDAHISRRGEELLLRLMTPQSPQVRALFVAFYADVHFTRCLAVHLVEVQGMRSEYVKLLVGQSVDRIVNLLPADVQGASAISMYTSHPEQVIVQQAAVDPSFGARFAVTVTATRMGQSCCRLHAVDPAARRCVASVLLLVSADPPVARYAHDIALPVLAAARKQLPFRNESSRDVTYRVLCSDPAIAIVQTPQLVISAHGEGLIELLFHAIPATLAYSAEIYVFITSDDRVIQETRVLRLTYS